MKHEILTDDEITELLLSTDDSVEPDFYLKFAKAVLKAAVESGRVMPISLMALIDNAGVKNITETTGILAWHRTRRSVMVTSARLIDGHDNPVFSLLEMSAHAIGQALYGPSGVKEQSDEQATRH